MGRQCQVCKKLDYQNPELSFHRSEYEHRSVDRRSPSTEEPNKANHNRSPRVFVAANEIITDYDDDTHFCLKCHSTIIGLDNYVSHRKARCSKNLGESPKSPLPSQLLPPDESFGLKADDFFSSLELRSSSKKPEAQSTSGKNFSGVLTRSKITALQAISSTSKEPTEPQQSKSGKNVWIGGHQLKELGHGDNQSKLIKAVANLERRKEEPERLQVYDESDDESDDYDYEDDDFSSDDQEAPPRNYTGGKWKPSSPIQWRNSEQRDWNIPPPCFTGGKWKPSPKSTNVPPASHTKGKWKPSCQKEDDNIPPPTFTGSKWISSKKHDYLDIPSPTFTGSKWVTPKKQDDLDIPPPTFTGSKWSSSKKLDYQDVPPATHTKGKWKPRTDNEDDYPPPNHTKGKWKPKVLLDDEFPPPTHTKGKWKPKTPTEQDPLDLSKETEKVLDPSAVTDQYKIEKISKLGTTYQHSDPKEKWLSTSLNKEQLKITEEPKSKKMSEYWCNACNRKLASKVVYERHLKSELHFKRTLHDREFDVGDEIALLKDKRLSKVAPPEPIFSPQKKTTTDVPRRRIRRKKYEKCDVCQAKVNKYLMGKHLISHYHCRKGDITTPTAKSMVIENIHGIVLESPFQCSICKFYCNTHEDFLRHWKSPYHVEKEMPGYFFCIFCEYKAENTTTMYDHLESPTHMEVVSVINRSVPIVIKKIQPLLCPSCGKDFQYNIQLMHHCKKLKHADADFLKKVKNKHVCDLCDFHCRSNVSLKRHKQNVHKQTYFVCTPCNLKFSTVEEGKTHMKSLQHRYSRIDKNKMGESQKRKCQYCQESFGNFLLLKEHLKDKHPEHKIRCPHCGANFTISQELTLHLRTKSCKFEEDPKNSLRCDKCPFSTNSTSELFFHNALHEEPFPSYSKNKDTDSKPTYKYKCPVCSKFFPKGSLHAHIMQHTKERPFICKTCGAKFARKNNLQFHEKNHDKREVKQKTKMSGDRRPFLCCTCGASFKKKFILQQHMQIHTGKACKCPHEGCVYTARKISEITEHFKTHSDERNFSCYRCEYKAKTKQQLSRHMSIHNETKKFECSQCSFTARDSSHLKRHARVHTGAKPFNCPHCSYRCNTSENLRKHVLATNKHPGKCIYECKFCSKYATNSAKDFKVHLVRTHSKTFGNGADAATYISGIYDVRYDNTYIASKPTPLIEEPNKCKQKLKTNVDPVVALASVPTSSGKDQMDHMLPTFVIPKDEDCSIGENLPLSWNLVGRYDVEEESGTLIPFESKGENLFEEHFQ